MKDSVFFPFSESNNEVTELTWENGQLAIHGLGGLLPTKPTWGRASDTLESMVHQATLRHKELLPSHHDHDQINPANTSSTLSVSVSAVKSTESSGFAQVPSGSTNKRTRSESDRCIGNFKSGFQEERERGSACASGSATFYRENDDTTMMMTTWASLEECPSSSKGKTVDEDSASHGGSEDMNEEQRETKGETSRSQSIRRSRASANHNMSERRRRDKINEKMKALQRLVPNASKSDKASMLDEVIEYLKQLQAQVQMMSTRSLPQMIMPTALGMQQQMQMSILARMGMGVGLGMGPMGNVARQSMPSVIHPGQVVSASTSPFFSPPFVMPPVMPSHAPNATAINHSVPFNNPYCPFFPQPMNVELYNKMAAMYQQQMNQTTQPTTSNPMPPANVEGG